MDSSIAATAFAELRRQFDAEAEHPDWDAISRAAGVSRRQVERAFRAAHGTSPARYWAELKAREAERLLHAGADVLSAAAQSGHSGPGRLHDAMIGRRGMTPGQIRARGAGVSIRYGLFESTLCTVLIAATDRGLCALRLCGMHSPEWCLNELKSEWPGAEFAEDACAVQHYADELAAFLERRSDRFLPDIDVEGTPFQREVWAELRKLPPGETATYSEIAHRIGRPRAARAVGAACARNGIAIAIPCHRAVGKDGALTGYRWGMELKRKLLEAEGE